VVPRLLPDMAMALARLRSPALGWHASSHARCTHCTRHWATHAIEVHFVPHTFAPAFAQMPNTKQQALNEMSDNESNETPMRVKMVKNTTGDASVWRSPPPSIFMADATSPRALPAPSPKWTVLGSASLRRPAAVTATAKPATAEMVSVGEGHEAGGKIGVGRCQHGLEGGLENSDAAAGELGMGAMAAGEQQQGTRTRVRWRPLMDRRAFGTSHVSQGAHGISRLMSPPRAHVRTKALCNSARCAPSLDICSYGCSVPLAPKIDDPILSFPHLSPFHLCPFHGTDHSISNVLNVQ